MPPTKPASFNWLDEGLSGIFVLAVVIQAIMGLTLRGVYADGALYVNMIAQGHDFSIPTPARWLSTIFFELPAVVASRLGVEAPDHLALIFSVTTNILPGVFFLLCRAALPAVDKRYFLFPVFVYFAGTLSAQFASGAIEGLPATPYLWLLFYLILFGSLSRARLCLILLLSIGCIRLHEQTSFLCPLLMVTAWIRRRDAPTMFARMALDLSQIALLVSAVAGTYLTLRPYYPDERAGLIHGLLELRWLCSRDSFYNLPAVVGVGAGVAILACIVFPKNSRLAAATFCVPSLALAIAAFWVDELTSPGAQFAARYNAALMSFPLMIVVLVARFVPGILDRLTSRSIVSIVMVLGVSASLWHIQVTGKWSAFLSHFRSVLVSSRGIISQAVLYNPPGSRAEQLSKMMDWGWTNPDLSIVALPRRCVTSIIDNGSRREWQPHQLNDLATMPRIGGLTYTYLLPPEMQESACTHPE